MKRWNPFHRHAANGQPGATGRGPLLMLLLALPVLLCGWLAGLLIDFPSPALEARLEQEVNSRLRGQGRLELEGLTPQLPFTIGVRAGTLNLVQPAMAITAEDLVAAPLWRSLLGGNPGLSFSAQLLGGEAQGFARRDGELDLKLRDLRLAFPLLENSQLAIEGVLTQGAFTGLWPPRDGSESRLALTLTGVRLTGLSTLGAQGDALELGNLELVGTGQGKSFKIERLEGRDGHLIGTGSGSLLLADNFPASRMNLTLNLKTTAEMDGELRKLLTLLAPPAADGSLTLRLSGTLARPNLN
ncbi:type II secretion system protein GspN [Trichloromonas sp.]|uniref:type II secretion system protein GspN n=1 Tax=Trichloromonas sp. TaxID=3069249 RepID=UPI002A4D5A37|nr:type II secretion system protein GspN [Trichloromonas sp.]